MNDYNFHLSNKTLALLMTLSVSPQRLLDQAQAELDAMDLPDPFSFAMHVTVIEGQSFILMPGVASDGGGKNTAVEYGDHQGRPTTESVGIMPAKWRQFPMPDSMKEMLKESAPEGIDLDEMTVQFPEADFDEQVLN